MPNLTKKLTSELLSHDNCLAACIFLDFLSSLVYKNYSDVPSGLFQYSYACLTFCQFVFRSVPFSPVNIQKHQKQIATEFILLVLYDFSYNDFKINIDVLIWNQLSKYLPFDVLQTYFF